MPAPPTPPLEDIRKSIEMIQGLPGIMSPTIPPWPNPTRAITGGKQPGKVPKAPSVIGMSSNESSDTGSESGISSSDLESDVGSSTPTRKYTGRKTSQRRGSKSELGGKRPGSSVSGTIPPESTHARKTSVGQCCCELSSRQVAELPRRIGEMTISKSPVVIKINIPSRLLPIKPLARTNRNKVSSSSLSSLSSSSSSSSTTTSASKSKPAYKMDTSSSSSSSDDDDDRDMDIDKPNRTRKENNFETSRKSNDFNRKDSKKQDKYSSPTSSKTT
ncbi:hypothetical protein BGZ76_006195, partial [Entomortierella beljakovae]